MDRSAGYVRDQPVGLAVPVDRAGDQPQGRAGAGGHLRRLRGLPVCSLAGRAGPLVELLAADDGAGGERWIVDDDGDLLEFVGGAELVGKAKPEMK